MNCEKCLWQKIGHFAACSGCKVSNQSTPYVSSVNNDITDIEDY